MTAYLLDTQPGLSVVLSATTGPNTDRYLYDPTGIAAQENNAGIWSYAIKDGLGSVRGQVDSSLAVLGSQGFEPYGTPVDVSGSVSLPHGYTGEWTDQNSLVHLRARYMNPATANFISLDPLETANRYGYVGGNPVNRVDPSGLILENPNAYSRCGGKNQSLPCDITETISKCDCYTHNSDKWHDCLACKVPDCTSINKIELEHLYASGTYENCHTYCTVKHGYQSPVIGFGNYIECMEQCNKYTKIGFGDDIVEDVLGIDNLYKIQDMIQRVRHNCDPVDLLEKTIKLIAGVLSSPMMLVVQGWAELDPGLKEDGASRIHRDMLDTMEFRSFGIMLGGRVNYPGVGGAWGVGSVTMFSSDLDECAMYTTTEEGVALSVDPGAVNFGIVFSTAPLERIAGDSLNLGIEAPIGSIGLGISDACDITISVGFSATLPTGTFTKATTGERHSCGDIFGQLIH